MANGKIRFGKQSGGELALVIPDGVANTEVIVPESGILATLSNIQGFKNLVINGRKQVNQSGLTVTDNAYNYDNHYKVGNNWFMFIDGKNIESGQPYTLSWDGIATAGYYIGTAGALTINAQTFTPIANGETITPTVTSNQILWIKFASDGSGSTYNKVQFEPGTIATPFEQRLYELEESLVQSCYQRINTIFSETVSANAGVSTKTISLLTKMRVTPIAGEIYESGGGVATTIISMTTNSLRIYHTLNSTSWFRQSVYIIDARPY